MDWARRFILSHGKRYPREMGAEEVSAFLTHLATARNSASTQNQAKAALLFLYKRVLGIELLWLDEMVQAKVKKRLPVVLIPCEVRALLDELNGTMWLVVSLLYTAPGCGCWKGCGCSVVAGRQLLKRRGAHREG